jgi:hypothetical protein
MAKLNEHGNIIAKCPGCEGATSVYVWAEGSSPLSFPLQFRPVSRPKGVLQTCFRLYKCSGCGRGALARLAYGFTARDLASAWSLEEFHYESAARVTLPASVPEGIRTEFREAEDAMTANCNRAAAALFRSVVDKAMLASGLRKHDKESLAVQINRAADAGVIHDARRLNAHRAVRALGNDVLHAEWRKVEDEEVQDAQHYVSRVLDDLYDERGAVRKRLLKNGHTPEEDKTEKE